MAPQLLTTLLTRDDATFFRALRDGLRWLYGQGCERDWLRLIIRISAMSAATLLPCLAVFLMRRPSALQSGMWAQVALHGFPIVLLVNLAVARYYAQHLDRFLGSEPLGHFLFLLGDAAARLLLTMLLTAVSFLLWTAVKGAFAGNPASALGAVAGSFRFGIRFESLTGVYLYAIGLGAFPVFALGALPILATQRWCQAMIAPAAYLLPIFRRPLMACLLAYAAVSAVLLTLTYHALGLLPN
ncbi:MAG: hypothetical protein AAF184_11900 [Pseudomonadota bacterium]